MEGNRGAGVDKITCIRIAQHLRKVSTWAAEELEGTGQDRQRYDNASSSDGHAGVTEERSGMHQLQLSGLRTGAPKERAELPSS